jgi:hypothetical protein
MPTMRTKTTSDKVRVPAWTALVIACATLACQPPPSVSPYVQNPPSSPAEQRNPLEVRAAEPRVGDLTGLLDELGVVHQFWDYEGPACAIKFTIEVRDDRVGGGSQVVAEDSFDLVGPEARFYFILLPPSGPEAPPQALFGTDVWGERNLTRAALPRLWYDDPEDRTLKTNIDTDPFVIEDVHGAVLVSMISDREDDGPRAQRQRIELAVRLSVLPSEAP